MKNIKIYSINSIIISLILITSFSCEDALEVAPPNSQILQNDVFNNDASANSAILGIYGQMVLSGFASGDLTSVSTLGGVSSDILIDYPGYDFANVEFDLNDLNASNPYNFSLWSSMYQTIYQCNSAIEGILQSDGLSNTVKQQLLGEALFVRAFTYFYIVNVYGNAPLVLSTDYEINSLISQSSENDIYDQILDDLITAKEILSDTYNSTNQEKIRPNKSTAIALLARVYLYLGDWVNAENEASFVLNNSQYNLESDLNNVFLKNSSEAIWQLQPISPNSNTGATNEGLYFSPLYSLYFNVLAPGFEDIFEVNDQRLTYWIGSIDDFGNTVYHPYKYKQSNTYAPYTEYSMVIRLAEIYLIRAEARANSGNLSGALDDLNAIRNRAGLSNFTSNNQGDLMNAILNERKVEFFSEWGHRWLDLKRTGEIVSVMSLINPSFNESDGFYPIPEEELNNNPNLIQNPGY